MRSGEKAYRLEKILGDLSDYNDAIDAGMNDASKEAEFFLRSAYADAYRTYTSELAVAAMKENRTRMFAELTDEQFAEIIGRLGGNRG